MSMSRAGRDALALEEQLGILLACRTIYTKDLKVGAFELLLNNESDNGYLDLSDFLAASDIIGEYADIYQDGRAARVPMFLRVEISVLLCSPTLRALGSKYLLEVDAAAALSSGVMLKLGELISNGQKLALRVRDLELDGLDAFLEHVEVVALELDELGDASLVDNVRRFHSAGVRVRIDGVDDMTQLERCVAAGADYLKGDFLAHGSPSREAEIPPNRLLLLELLAELNRVNTTPMELEAIAVKDPSLAYRILKGINSAASGLQREIDSLWQAISLMGTNELKRWTYMLLVEPVAGKPAELTRLMLVRGRMCEVLAEISGRGDPMNCFVVGLLSHLDALLDMDMESLVREMPLSQPLKSALLRREGATGEVLAEVEHYSEGEFDRLAWIVDAQHYEVAYRHSVGWARQVQESLGEV